MREPTDPAVEAPSDYRVRTCRSRKGAEGALGTAARLGRMGRVVMADAELRQGAPDLRSHGLRHRLTGSKTGEITGYKMRTDHESATAGTQTCLEIGSRLAFLVGELTLSDLPVGGGE
jgi:hypothetical protein